MTVRRLSMEMFVVAVVVVVVVDKAVAVAEKAEVVAPSSLGEWPLR